MAFRKGISSFFVITFVSLAGLARSGVFDAATPIVFVHGFEGSTLVDSRGSVKWLTLLESLGLKAPSLALPMIWENGVQPRDQLKPGEPLKGVHMLRGLIGVDVYGPWLKRLAKLKRPVYNFVYDWRRDPLEVNDEFAQFLARISREHAGHKLDVIGHSLGALYVMAAVNEHPELFNQAILVGAPLSGDINAIADIQKGFPTGLNHRILSPDVIFTFPSVFVFLPLGTSRIVDRAGNPEILDYYAPGDWETHRLGPFYDAKDPEKIDKLRKFLATSLEHAKRFRQLLDPRPIAYPKIRVVSGNTVPTRAKAIRNGPSSERGLDFKSAPRVPGDGETRVEDSVPKPGIPYDIYYSRKTHIHMMDSPIIMKLLQSSPE